MAMQMNADGGKACSKDICWRKTMNSRAGSSHFSEKGEEMRLSQRGVEGGVRPANNASNEQEGKKKRKMDTKKAWPSKRLDHQLHGLKKKNREENIIGVSLNVRKLAKPRKKTE